MVQMPARKPHTWKSSTSDCQRSPKSRSSLSEKTTAPVGQISAQALQPKQPDALAPKGAVTRRCEPRKAKPMAFAPTCWQARTQSPHRIH